MFFKTATVLAIFFSAMAFELSFKSLILSIKKSRKVGRGAVAPLIMTSVNLFGCLYGPVYLLSNFIDTNCQGWALSFKVVMHIFFILFGNDLFLVFKSWVVSQKRPAIAVVGGLLLIHRIGWAVWDNMKSYAFMDPSSKLCFYNQDQLSSFGFLLADLLVDFFCTLVTGYVAIRDVDRTSTRMQSLYRILIAENVLRTAFLVTVNTVTVYYASQSAFLGNLSASSDTDLMLMFPALLNYIYAVALNTEFFFAAMRAEAVKGAQDV
ncbi:hypothetical protein BC830DRAFT_522768 [Chytriomyces sp. MP71]|nr:hypothetical protein BC830DRAFT_522768 [Chytriomyces sp. MP71]